MKWLLFGLLSATALHPGGARAVTPVTADQCRIVTLQSPDLSEADLVFLTEQHGGMLRLCHSAQAAHVVENTYISPVERLAVGLCRYFIGGLHDAETGGQHRWSLAPTSSSSKGLHMQYLADGTQCPPAGMKPDAPTYRLDDSLYIRVGSMADALFVEFMRYWLDTLSSQESLDRQLAPKQRESVLRRSKETLWLLAGCIAARAQGCSVHIHSLDVASYAQQELIQVSFRIEGFSRIGNVFDGKTAYLPQQQRYNGIIGVWHTDAGFALAD